MAVRHETHLTEFHKWEDDFHFRNSYPPTKLEAWQEATRQAEARSQAEIVRLREALHAESEAHAQLQAKCFDYGNPTHSSIFDECSELKAEIVRLREVLRKLTSALHQEFGKACLCDIDGLDQHAPRCPVERAVAILLSAPDNLVVVDKDRLEALERVREEASDTLVILKSKSYRPGPGQIRLLEEALASTPTNLVAVDKDRLGALKRVSRAALHFLQPDHKSTGAIERSELVESLQALAALKERK